MADVTVKRIEDFEAIFGGGFRRVRAGLGVSSFGLAVIELPPDFTVYPEHDQAHDHQEEVYTLLTGRATLRVGGAGARSTSSSPGCGFASGMTRSARSSPATTRRECWRSVAHRVRPYDAPEFTEEGGAAPPRSSKTRAPTSGRGRRPRRAAAPQRRRRRPRSVHQRSAPRITTAGSPRPCRAPGRRRRRAGRRPRSRSRPARGRGRRRARASRRAATMPAQPIATSAWPSRHGRPKLSAITHRRARAAGRARDLGAHPARRGVGVQRAAAPPRRRRGRWRRRCRRWRRSSRRSSRRSAPPRSARTIRRDLGEHELDQTRIALDLARRARSRPCPARPLPRSRTRPSAFETTFWETTTIVAVARAAAPPPRRSARRPRRPRRPRAGRRERGDLEAGAHAAPEQPESFQGRGGRGRALGLARRAAAASAARSSGVSRSRPSDSSGSVTRLVAGPLGPVAVALGAARAERGPDRVGGSEQQRRSCRCRGDQAPPRPGPAPSAPARRRARPGRAAGSRRQQSAASAPSDSARMIPRVAASEWPCRPGRGAPRSASWPLRVLAARPARRGPRR